MDIAGHVSRQMLKHYSHIRMQAKREALDAVQKKQQQAEDAQKPEGAKHIQNYSPVLRKLKESPYKNPYNWVFQRPQSIEEKHVSR